MKVVGSYPYVTPEKEQVWSWRTEIEMMNADEIKMTAYSLPPIGDREKAIANET